MEKKIEFIVNNTILRGSIFTPKGKGPFPAVIFFHGSGSKGLKYFEAAKHLSESGVLAFVFNFRGCGLSDGDYLSQTYEDAFLDAKSAFELLLCQNIDPERIGVVGGSFGGFIASILLPQILIKSLVLLNPSAHDGDFSEKIDMGGLDNEIKYFANPLNWEDSKSFENIQNFKGKLLIIKSQNDENVPHEVLDKYFQKAINTTKKELIKIANADHRLSKDVWKEDFFSIIRDWFLKTL